MSLTREINSYILPLGSCDINNHLGQNHRSLYMSLGSFPRRRSFFLIDKLGLILWMCMQGWTQDLITWDAKYENQNSSNKYIN